MTVDIHPEDLIDKLTDGEISPAEQERLRAHLSLCASCRFELSVRGDFLAEMPVIAERPHLGLGAALDEPVRAPVAKSARAPRRRRVAFVLIAAALVLCAGGAAAVTGAGARVLPWAFRDSSHDVLEHAATASNAAKPATKRGGHVVTPADVSAVPSNTPDLATSADGALAAPEAPAASPAAANVEPAKTAPAPLVPSAMTSSTAAPAPSVPSSIDFAAALDSAAPSLASAVPDAPPVVEDAAAVFSQANRARRDGNAERAELLYRSLQARFPSSAESELSREVLAQMLLERGNAAAALSGFDHYLVGGSGGLAAEALVGRARALEQLGQREQAAAAWRVVASRYPGTVHARLAATRLATLDPE